VTTEVNDAVRQMAVGAKNPRARQTGAQKHEGFRCSH